MHKLVGLLLSLVLLVVGVLGGLLLYVNLREKADAYRQPTIEQDEGTGGTAQEGEA